MDVYSRGGGGSWRMNESTGIRAWSEGWEEARKEAVGPLNTLTPHLCTHTGLLGCMKTALRVRTVTMFPKQPNPARYWPDSRKTLTHQG